MATAHALGAAGLGRGVVLEREPMCGTHASGRNAAIFRLAEGDAVIGALAHRAQCRVRELETQAGPPRASDWRSHARRRTRRAGARGARQEPPAARDARVALLDASGTCTVSGAERIPGGGRVVVPRGRGPRYSRLADAVYRPRAPRRLPRADVYTSRRAGITGLRRRRMIEHCRRRRGSNPRAWS